MTSATLHPGNVTPVFVAPAATEKYCKGANLGQYLQGTATFAKDEVGKKVDVYPFKYILPDAGKKKDKFVFFLVRRQTRRFPARKKTTVWRRGGRVIPPS